MAISTEDYKAYEDVFADIKYAMGQAERYLRDVSEHVVKLKLMLENEKNKPVNYEDVVDIDERGSLVIKDAELQKVISRKVDEVQILARTAELKAKADAYDALHTKKTEEGECDAKGEITEG